MRRSVALGAAAIVIAATACGIDPDGEPRVVPAEQRIELDPADQAAGQAAGASRVFLLVEEENGQVLRSVPRDVPAQPLDVLQALFAGPNEREIEDGLQTALPADTEVRSARKVGGTLNVDLSPEILEMQSTAVRLAVAQIVFTADELDGVTAVRLRVDGQNRAWPAGRGDLQNESLTVYDFPGYAESAQPAYPPIPGGTIP
jgi:spore germination protein GerM